MEYPEKLSRGISSKNFIDAEGRLTSQAFQFDPSSDHPELDEASINWYDNEEAMQIAWDQKKNKDDELPQFKGGVAILSRASVDYVFSQPYMIGMLQYERKPSIGNPYHGNLLRKHGLTQNMRNFIASTIAMVCVDEIIPRE